MKVCQHNFSKPFKCGGGLHSPKGNTLNILSRITKCDGIACFSTDGVCCGLARLFVTKYSKIRIFCTENCNPFKAYEKDCAYMQTVLTLSQLLHASLITHKMLHFYSRLFYNLSKSVCGVQFAHDITYALIVQVKHVPL